MKTILDRVQLVALAVAVVAAVYVPQVLAQSKEDIAAVCHQAGKNAVYGASQRMRDAPYQFKWVTSDDIKQLVQAGASGTEALYMHSDIPLTAEQKAHAEGEVTKGYALMEIWIAAYGREQMPDPKKIYNQFDGECKTKWSLISESSS